MEPRAIERRQGGEGQMSTSQPGLPKHINVQLE